MDLGPALALGLLWFLFNLFGRKKRTDSWPKQPSPPTPRPTSKTTIDPTQLEGARLQDLFRELGRALDQGAGPRGRPAPARLPPAEEVEETVSLEVEPGVESLEREVDRPLRVLVDRDDEAEGIAARRIAAAQKSSRATTGADHAVFDARIRREPADVLQVGPPDTARLRRAVIWREILGRPVSLRRGDEP